MSRSDFVHGQMNEVPASIALPALNRRFVLAADSDFGSDVDVLNYALTLEYLEAAFYEQGNAANLLSGEEKARLAKIQTDEEAHVTAITQTIQKLGGSPVAKPTVDFGDSFDSRDKYLMTSHTFENVGVGAYLGAAGFIKDKTILQAAAGIFGVEARHAAIVGNLLGLKAEGGVYMGATETPQDKMTVLSKVTPFLPGSMPSGAPETGGGSTSGVEDKTLLGSGGAALLGAGAIAAYAMKRHSKADGAA
ncbi:MAG TPA: ferritin-like domain-containing protein [Mycobacteriales bacterium]|nr:ferritin-like domain-containing protein [Mycobacteriales bacterium]